MKTKIKILGVVLMSLIVSTVLARDEYTKVMKKDYTVNPDAQLIISNSFGNVHLSNWEKNEIQIEVSVTVVASDDKSAQKMFDKVEVTFAGTPAQVEARAAITEGGFNGRNGVRIEFKVIMPVSISLDITNKFGNIYLNEVGGKAKINLGYGKMEAGKFLNSDNLLDIKFSDINVKSIKGAVVNLKYSQMNLEYAGSIRLDSKYSTLDAGRVISLVASCEGGKINMDNGSVLECKSKFSDLNVDLLDQNLSLDFQYGNCDIDLMPAGFTGITLKNKYGNVDIGISPEANYSLDAELKFCDLDFPVNRADISQRIITNTSKTYKAVIGKDGGNAPKVFVRSEFGNVSLE